MAMRLSAASMKGDERASASQFLIELYEFRGVVPQLSVAIPGVRGHRVGKHCLSISWGQPDPERLFDQSKVRLGHS